MISMKSNNFIKEYNKNGFVVIRNLINQKKAKNLEKQTFDFIKKKLNFYNGRDINFTLNKSL